ncbi:MAG: hypothetical protein WCZ86_03120 [Desulfurivibrionaceae bacterium]
MIVVIAKKTAITTITLWELFAFVHGPARMGQAHPLTFFLSYEGKND